MSLNAEAVVAALQSEESVAAASRRLGVSRSTLRGFIEREQIDAKTLIIRPEPKKPVTKTSIEALIRERGFSLDEVVVKNMRLNQWGSCPDCGHEGLSQDRVDLQPRTDLLVPARSEGWKPPKDAKSRKVTGGLIAAMGDFHCPHYEPELVRCAVQWVKDNKPEQLLLIGDLLDFGEVSSHRKTGNEPSLQDEVESAYDLLRSFREASPGTRIRLLDGNHEDRLVRALESKGLLSVAQLKRPGDDHPMLATAHYLRLDELEVEQVFPPENLPYEFAEMDVTGDLRARHGHKIGQGGGMSVAKMIEEQMRSMLIGHCHRQAIVQVTKWIDGVARVFTGCEVGTMSQVVHGLGYANAGSPNWQQGFAVIQAHDDTYSIELARFINNTLYWRDRSWS